jgi:septal ring factor EnvC (AmiA/AmiB activator)
MSEKDFNHIMDDMRKEIKALKQQLHTDRVNFLKQHDKEIALVREDVQITQLSLEKRISELEAINKHHQKINGELQEKLSKYEDKAAHYRRKAIL